MADIHCMGMFDRLQRMHELDPDERCSYNNMKQVIWNVLLRFKGHMCGVGRPRQILLLEVACVVPTGPYKVT